MKRLPDLDKDHPFYSDEANKLWLKRIKKAEEEEKEMIRENRRRRQHETSEE